MLTSRLIPITALALYACADTGTETDNPVVDFEASECSGPLADVNAQVARTSAALTLERHDYHALYCYAWQAHENGAVTIDVINYQGSCAVMYELAEARVESDHIELGITNPSCLIGKCDTTCLYDFTFELTGVDTSRPATVRLREVACDGSYDDQLEPELQLPIDSEPEGVLCRQMIYSAGPPACGVTRTPPCGGDYFGTCEDGCGDGLACGHYEPFDRDMCFSECSEDGDCELAIESCRGGICQLRETF